MKKALLTLLVGLALLPLDSGMAQDRIPAFRVEEAVTGVARLSIDRKVVSLGQPITITVEYENTSDTPRTVYPVFRGSLLQRAGANLVIFNDKGERVGNLLARIGGSSRYPDDNDWLRLAPGETHKEEFRLNAGRGEWTIFRHETEIAPGVYSIQAIFLRRFFSDPATVRFAVEFQFSKRLIDSNTSKYLPCPLDEELLRSNAVKIEILGAPPANNPRPKSSDRLSIRR